MSILSSLLRQHPEFPVGRAIPIDADAVAEWWGQSPQDLFVWADFPNCAPAFQLSWIEYEIPGKLLPRSSPSWRWGALVKAVTPASGSTCRWWLRILFWAKFAGQGVQFVGS